MATTAEARPGQARLKPAARSAVFQIPRNALALLMMAQLAVLLPHMAQLSLWIVGVALFCGFWRTQIFRGRWGYPNALIKGLLVLCSIIGVAVSGTGGFSLEGATALLLLAFALKLLEMKTRRDAILVIFLSYFVIATQFLFDQSLPLAVYEVGATVLVTAALIGMNQVHAQVRPLRSLRIAGYLIAQAVPLTLVLFLFFPRIAPLWSMPLPSGAKTGLSDRMKPGDVARLSRSDELAFRVSFQGEVPANPELYFRGLVFPRYRDGEWIASPGDELGRSELGPRGSAEPLRYDVLIEPTASKWLFGLDTVASPRGPLMRTEYHTLQANNPVHAVFRYRVESYPDQLLEPTELSESIRAESLALQADRNPRLRRLARRWWQAAGGEVRQFAATLIEHIRTEPFHYTLTPGVLPEVDAVDAFWFDSREGFCTHYAGATVVAFRAVGVPARLVAGYQGGVINSITGHLEVRQYDAHSWVEYWEAGQGWQRLDPTAAVAPDRIRQGLSAALSSADRSQLSLFANARLGEGGLIGTALEWFDSLEHRWNLWVVGFDDNQQRGLLTRLLGELTPRRIGLAMLAGGALSLSLVTLLLFWRARPLPRPALERSLLLVQQGAERLGYPRQLQESPGRYFDRLLAQGVLKAPVPTGPAGQSFGEQLEAALYNPSAPAQGERLKRQLRQWRWRLLLQRY